MATVTDWDSIADEVLGPITPMPAPTPPPNAQPDTDWDALADSVLGPVQQQAASDMGPVAPSSGYFVFDEDDPARARTLAALGIPQYPPGMRRYTEAVPDLPTEYAGGATPPTPLPRAAQDTLTTATKGLVGVGQAVAGLLDLVAPDVRTPAMRRLAEQTGAPSGSILHKAAKELDAAQETLQYQYSPETQKAHAAVAAKKGFLNKIGAALQNPSVIATTIGESIPSMLAGGAIGRGVGALGKAGGWLSKGGFAAGEGAMTAGSIEGQSLAESKTGETTIGQKGLAVAGGVLTGLISALSGKVASQLGVDDIDKLLAGNVSNDVKQNVITRAIARALASDNIAARASGKSAQVGIGATQEGFEELFQSYQEQIAGNLAQDKPWHEGLDDAAVMGLLSGGVMGGGTQLRPISRLQVSRSQGRAYGMPDDIVKQGADARLAWVKDNADTAARTVVTAVTEGSLTPEKAYELLAGLQPYLTPQPEQPQSVSQGEPNAVQEQVPATPDVSGGPRVEETGQAQPIAESGQGVRPSGPEGGPTEEVKAEVTPPDGETVLGLGETPVSPRPAATVAPAQDQYFADDKQKPRPEYGGASQQDVDDAVVAMRIGRGREVSSRFPQVEHENEIADFLRSRNRKFAFVDTDRPGFAGAWQPLPNGNGVMLINGSYKGRGGDLWFVVGHELAHQSGLDTLLPSDSDLMQERRNHVLQRSPEDLRKEYQDNPDLLDKEVRADFVGEFLRNADFRAELQRTNPTLWQRLRDFVLRVLGQWTPQDEARKAVLDELRLSVSTAKAATPATEQQQPPPRKVTDLKTVEPTVEEPDAGAEDLNAILGMEEEEVPASTPETIAPSPAPTEAGIGATTAPPPAPTEAEQQPPSGPVELTDKHFAIAATVEAKFRRSRMNDQADQVNSALGWLAVNKPELFAPGSEGKLHNAIRNQALTQFREDQKGSVPSGKKEGGVERAAAPETTEPTETEQAIEEAKPFEKAAMDELKDTDPNLHLALEAYSNGSFSDVAKAIGKSRATAQEWVKKGEAKLAEIIRRLQREAAGKVEKKQEAEPTPTEPQQESVAPVTGLKTPSAGQKEPSTRQARIEKELDAARLRIVDAKASENRNGWELVKDPVQGLRGIAMYLLRDPSTGRVVARGKLTRIRTAADKYTPEQHTEALAQRRAEQDAERLLSGERAVPAEGLAPDVADIFGLGGEEAQPVATEKSAKERLAELEAQSEKLYEKIERTDNVADPVGFNRLMKEASQLNRQIAEIRNNDPELRAERKREAEEAKQRAEQRNKDMAVKEAAWVAEQPTHQTRNGWDILKGDIDYILRDPNTKEEVYRGKLGRVRQVADESPPETQPKPEATAEQAKPSPIVDTIAGRMSLDEFESKGYSPDQVTRADWVNLQRAARRAMGQSEDSGTQFAPNADYEEYHKQSVKDALAKGEDVDPEVLADYPDLQAKAPEVKEEEATQPEPAPEPTTNAVEPPSTTWQRPDFQRETTKDEETRERWRQAASLENDKARQIRADKERLERELKGTRRNAHKKRGKIQGEIREKERALGDIEKAQLPYKQDLELAAIEDSMETAPSEVHWLERSMRRADLLARRRGIGPSADQHRRESERLYDNLRAEVGSEVDRVAKDLDKTEKERLADHVAGYSVRRMADSDTLTDLITKAIPNITQTRIEAELEWFREPNQYGRWDYSGKLRPEHLTPEQRAEYRERIKTAAVGAHWKQKVASIMEEAKAEDSRLEKIAEEKRKAEAEEAAKRAAEAERERAVAARERSQTLAKETRFWKSVAEEVRATKTTKGTVKKVITEDTGEKDAKGNPITKTRRETVPAEILPDGVWAIIENWNKTDSKEKQEEHDRYSLTHINTGLSATLSNNRAKIMEAWAMISKSGVDFSAVKTEKDMTPDMGKKVRAWKDAGMERSLGELEEADRARLLKDFGTKPTDVTADIMLDQSDFEERGPASAMLGVVKDLVKEVHEFSYNPVFTVKVKDGVPRLVYRDGYKFEFRPESFGLVAADLKDGQTVGLNLEDMGIARSTAQDVVRKVLDDAFQKVTALKGRISVSEGSPVVKVYMTDTEVKAAKKTQIWKTVYVSGTGENWSVEQGGDKALSKRVQSAIDKIRWTQPSQPAEAEQPQPPKASMMEIRDDATGPKFRTFNGLNQKQVAALGDLMANPKKYGTFDAFAKAMKKTWGAKWNEDWLPGLQEMWNERHPPAKEAAPEPEEAKDEVPPSHPEKVAEEAILPSDDDLTGIKKAVVNELRALAGLPEMENPTRQEIDDWVERARATLAADPTAALRLVNDLASNRARPINEEDAMLLQFRYRQLANELEPAILKFSEAVKSGDPAAIAVARSALHNARSAMTEFEEIIHPSKSTWGRTGVALQLMMRKDFSTAGILRRAKEANNGEALSEKQVEELTKLGEQLKDLQKRFDELSKKNEELARELASKEQHQEVQEEVKKSRRQSKSATRQAAEKRLSDAWAKMKSLLPASAFRVEKASMMATKEGDTPSKKPADGKGTVSGTSAEVFNNAVELAKAFINLNQGVVRYGEFLAHLRTHLATLDEAMFRKAWDQAAAAEQLVVSEIDITNLDMATRAALTKEARAIQRRLVEAGMNDRDEVLNAVHEILSADMPDLTKRQTTDALSRYGQWSQPSQEDIDVLLRRWNAELLKLSQIDQQEIALKRVEELRKEGKSDEEIGDILQQEKLLVEATGYIPDRPDPNDPDDPGKVVRDLTKQYNQNKKGIPATSEGRAGLLQTAISSIERGLLNRIKDINYEIENGPIVREKRERPTSERIKELEAERDRLLAIHREMFPPKKKQLSDEQRLANAIKAAERTEALLQKQIQTQDFDTPERRKLSSVELDALRARIEHLRAQREALKQLELSKWESEGGSVGEEPGSARARKIYEASLRRRIANYRQILASGDFSPKPKKLPRELSPSELKLKREMEDVRHKVLEKYAEYHLAHLTGIAWLGDKIAETAHLSRALMTSFDLSALLRQGGLTAMSHPLLAQRALTGTIASIAHTFDKGAMFNTENFQWDKLGQFLSGIDTRQAEFEFMHKINSGPAGEFRLRAGLSLSGTDEAITRQEEVFQGRWGKFVPGIAMSSRLYTMVLNKMRADLFDLMVDKLGRDGKVNMDEAMLIANFINVSTGRSSPLMLRKRDATAMLNLVFFAPRYVASRFQYLAMPFYLPFKGGISKNWRVKRAIYKEYGRTAFGIGLVLSTIAITSQMFGGGDDDDPWGEISLDWTNADFLKVRFGETRLDFMAGLSQVIVLSGRLIRGRTTSSETGKTTIFGDPEVYKAPTHASVTGRFLRTKFAPVPGAIWTAFDNMTDVVGQKHTVGSLAASAVWPLSLRDIPEAMQAQGIPLGTAMSLLSILGVGMNTYGPKTRFQTATPDERAEMIRKDLKRMTVKEHELPAYSEFLTPSQLARFRNRQEELMLRPPRAPRAKTRR